MSYRQGVRISSNGTNGIHQWYWEEGPHMIEQSDVGISTKQLHSFKQIKSVKQNEKQRTGRNSQWTIRRLSTGIDDMRFLEPTD